MPNATPPPSRSAVVDDVERGEQPLTIAQASRLPELVRDGRSPGVKSVYRWAQQNKFETARRPSGVFTTRSAILRMLRHMSGVDAAGAAPPDRATYAERRSHAQAERELAAAGI